jgi:DNA-binding LytR/AlgR family response regulator
MKVVIAEDEHLAAAKLEKMIRKHDPSIEVLAILDSVQASIDWLKSHESPDLIFLDIQLTDGTCFDIIKSVSLDCPVIFTTAYDQYALEAFNLQSIDYLIKPISQEKLDKAMAKLKKMQDGFSEKTVDFDKLLNAVEGANKTFKSRFLVKSGSAMKSVAVEEIAYFFSSDKLVFMMTKSRHRFVINETLDELELSLNPSDFFRINRQFIVHIDTILKVHPHFNGRLKIDLNPAPEEDIYISNRRATAFKEWMDK